MCCDTPIKVWLLSLDICAQFHEAVTAVATAVIGAIYGRNYSRNSFMKLDTCRNFLMHFGQKNS